MLQSARELQAEPCYLSETYLIIMPRVREGKHEETEDIENAASDDDTIAE